MDLVLFAVLIVALLVIITVTLTKEEWLGAAVCGAGFFVISLQYILKGGDSTFIAILFTSSLTQFLWAFFLYRKRS